MFRQHTPIAHFITQPPLGSEGATPLQNFAVLRNDAEEITGFAVAENEVLGTTDFLTDVSFDAARHMLWFTAGGKHHPVDTRELPTDALRELHRCCENGLQLAVFSLPVIEEEVNTATGEMNSLQG